MKKILLASTALVAMAGAAKAEVAISGFAEIGIFGSSEGFRVGTGGDEFHTDIDVTFSMTGETDNGLTFGASIDIDESADQGVQVDDGQIGTDFEDEFPAGEDDLIDIDALPNPDDPATRREVVALVNALNASATQAALSANPAFDNDSDDGGATYFVAFGGARLDMGDTDGAFDAALQEVALVGGSIRDDETEHGGYNGNSGLDGSGDGQIARFSYAFEGFTGHLSVEQSNDGVDDDPIWGVGVSYDAELAGINLGVGLGYQTTEQFDGADIWGISLDTTFDNGLAAAINYSSSTADDEDFREHVGIGLGYEFDAFSIGFNWGQYMYADNTDIEDVQGVGLVANYDLGGGLVAQAGWGRTMYDDDDLDDDDSYSIGLAMSF